MNTEDYRNAELDRADLSSECYTEDDMPKVLFYGTPIALIICAGLVCFATWKLAPSLSEYVHAWLRLWGAK